MWNSPGCVPGRGPCLQGAGRASAGTAPLAGRAPLQAAAPPPQAPSETNAAHGGLYGARRQRVARLTLRGKFGGGRQGALMRGPPAAAAARGGGGCGPGGNVSRALGRHPRAPPLHLPRSDRGQVEEQEAPCSRPCSLLPGPHSLPGALLLCASMASSMKWGQPSSGG